MIIYGLAKIFQAFMTCKLIYYAIGDIHDMIVKGYNDGYKLSDIIKWGEDDEEYTYNRRF